MARQSSNPPSWCSNVRHQKTKNPKRNAEENQNNRPQNINTYRPPPKSPPPNTPSNQYQRSRRAKSPPSELPPKQNPQHLPNPQQLHEAPSRPRPPKPPRIPPPRLLQNHLQAPTISIPPQRNQPTPQTQRRLPTPRMRKTNPRPPVLSQRVKHSGCHSLTLREHQTTKSSRRQ